MSLFGRTKPRDRLHVRIRGPEGEKLPVTLYPGHTLDIVDEKQRPTFRIKFRGEDGIEVVQLAPTMSADPEAWRRWAEFNEEEHVRP